MFQLYFKDDGKLEGNAGQDFVGQDFPRQGIAGQYLRDMTFSGQYLRDNIFWT